MRDELEGKYRRLKEILAEMKGVVVAYSGGVDSTLLLKAAVEALGERALAVTVSSEIHTPDEVAEAVSLGKRLGARHQTLHADPLANETFAQNPPDRCYLCKLDLFRRLLEIAREGNLGAVVEGSNVDDVGDYRPGMKALKELGVRSPLREAEFTKAEVREASRDLGLPTWDKPSLACLATRFPYGERITPQGLRRVAAAERLLRGLGIRQVRVRDYGRTARIEVGEEDFERIVRADNRARIVEELHKIGYLHVTADLEGYRAGSMNVQLGAHGQHGADT